MANYPLVRGCTHYPPYGVVYQRQKGWNFQSGRHISNFRGLENTEKHAREIKIRKFQFLLVVSEQNWWEHGMWVHIFEWTNRTEVNSLLSQKSSFEWKWIFASVRVLANIREKSTFEDSHHHSLTCTNFVYSLWLHDQDRCHFRFFQIRRSECECISN